MAQQFQGKLMITVAEAQNVNYNTHIVHAIANVMAATPNIIPGGNAQGTVFCMATLYDQVLKTKKVPRTPNPRWDASTHTFNVYDPFDEVVITICDENLDGSERVFGKVTLKLKDHGLVDQKLHDLTLNISGIDTKEIVGQLRAQVQYKYRKTWEALYKGTTALVKQQYPAAVALLTHHLNNQNSSKETLHMIYDLRCEAYCGMGKLNEALLDAAKVLELKPGDIPALIRLARVYVLRAEFAQAEKVLARAQDIAPDDPRVGQEKQICANEALIYRLDHKIKAAYGEFAKGASSNAVLMFSEALGEVPNGAIIYLYRAISHAAAGQIDNCLYDIEKMTEMQPGWPRTNPILEGTLQKRGEVNVMMKRRWFILKHCFLFYYKGNSDVLPQGVICLYGVTCTVKGRKEFQIHSDISKRVYEIKADSEDERNKWVMQINAIIGKKLSLPEADDASHIVASSRQIIQVNVVADIFTKISDGFFLPTKIATTVGEKIIASLTTIDLESQDKRGWLYKKGRLTSEGEWARRFFVLKGPYLYYMNPGQDEDLSDGSVLVPRGYIALEKCQINVAPGTTAQAFAFEITSKKSDILHQNIVRYMLSAESKADFDSWVAAIKKITDPPTVEESIPRLVAPPKEQRVKSLGSSQSAKSFSPSGKGKGKENGKNQSAKTERDFNRITDDAFDGRQAPDGTKVGQERDYYDYAGNAPAKPKVNFLADYTPPPDAHKAPPALPHAATSGDEESELSLPPSNTSLNADEPSLSRKYGMTEAESRYFKFGLPDPSLSPPPSETAPLLKDGEANEDGDGEVKKEEEESGCCCTVM